MTPKSKYVDRTKSMTTMRDLHVQCQLQQGGSNDLLLQRNSSDFGTKLCRRTTATIADECY